MYIYELKDWPNFHWHQEKIANLLACVRYNQGKLIGRMEGLGFSQRNEASLRTLTNDVLKSSEIEGERLDEAQVRSSIARRLGMDIGGLIPADRHVDGVVEMMLDATQGNSAPLTAERLYSWHASLFPTGRSGMSRIIVGDWRDDKSGPMQVQSGPVGREKIHFEAPSAHYIDREISTFLAWFNAGTQADPVIIAALAHLWFVTIHPFEDGNGRIARAITDMALARSELSPQRCYSMSTQIRQERNAYYERLEATQKGELDVTEWLEWFLQCLQNAIAAANNTLASVLAKSRFWEDHKTANLNDRQNLMLNRLMDGFEGKLTSSKWAKITKSSQDTAGRDIDDLVKRGILLRGPEGGRSTGYMLPNLSVANALKNVASYTRTHAAISVWDGPAWPTKEQITQRIAKITELAAKLDELAALSLQKTINYNDFDSIRAELQNKGFFPTIDLVSAVAFAIHRVQLL